MTQQMLYTGGEIRVAADDYSHSPYEADGDDESDGDEPIPRLDDVVSRRTMLTFTLDYPFPDPYHGRVFGKGGITLRHIVDAIRKGFRTMYAGAGSDDIPNLGNKWVTGSYGTACHVIDDLVIEGIEMDDATGEIDVGIGS